VLPIIVASAIVMLIVFVVVAYRRRKAKTPTEGPAQPAIQSVPMYVNPLFVANDSAGGVAVSAASTPSVTVLSGQSEQAPPQIRPVPVHTNAVYSPVDIYAQHIPSNPEYAHPMSVYGEVGQLESESTTDAYNHLTSPTGPVYDEVATTSKPEADHGIPTGNVYAGFAPKLLVADTINDGYDDFTVKGEQA
jgi:hypothetical protein